MPAAASIQAFGAVVGQPAAEWVVAAGMAACALWSMVKIIMALQRVAREEIAALDEIRRAIAASTASAATNLEALRAVAARLEGLSAPGPRVPGPTLAVCDHPRGRVRDASAMSPPGAMLRLRHVDSLRGHHGHP